MMRGEDIKRRIPQRNPMLMVDEFEALDEQTAHTALTVRSDNMFLYRNGELPESGLIEHIAQSASALAGYQALSSPQSGGTEGGLGTTQPPVGIIGEVKHFECSRRPVNGDKIETCVSFGFSFAGATIIRATSCIAGEQIAETQMKIFI